MSEKEGVVKWASWIGGTLLALGAILGVTVVITAYWGRLGGWLQISPWYILAFIVNIVCAWAIIFSDEWSVMVIAGIFGALFSFLIIGGIVGGSGGILGILAGIAVLFSEEQDEGVSSFD